jgi:hypothetical protein
MTIEISKRVRVCVNCKEFCAIDTSNYSDVQNLENFERKHRKHRMITILEEEMADYYKKFKG